MILSYIRDVDRQLAVTDKKVRVFFFKSDDRNVIEDIINRSDAMGDFLRINHKIDVRSGYNGLVKDGVIKEINVIKGIEDFAKEKHQDTKIFVIKDFGIHKEERAALWIKAFLDGEKNTVLFVSANMVNIPYAFANEVNLITVPNLSMEDIKKLFKEDIYGLEDADLKRLAGMSERQIKSIFIKCEGIDGEEKRKEFNDAVTEALEEDARKNPAFVIKSIEKAPRAVGMGDFSKWMREHKESFEHPEIASREGNPPTKGALIVGIPGTGKSAMAVEAARVLGSGKNPLPLIELSVEKMETKEYGGSEARFMNYLEKVEAMSPCVMLIDELEKSFALDNNSHEVRKQMFKILLKWLQERDAMVFTFVTANSITSVPEELLRDGRLDERFFAFMPVRDELAEILNCKLVEKNERMKAAAIEMDEYPVKDIYNIDAYLKADVDFSLSKKLFDEIATIAREAHKDKFFTGANVVKLVNETMNNCSKKYKTEEIDLYAELKNTAESMVTQGESGMSGIIDKWFAARKNKYKFTSGKKYFPFDKSDKADDADNTYDKWLCERIREEIEKRENEKKA